MATEDFTTYDETDEGTNVTVIAAKVSWVGVDRDETSHVSDSKGVNHFSGDFTHKFEFQASNMDNSAQYSHWALANAQADSKTLVDASADFYHFRSRNAAGTYQLRLFVVENGSGTNDEWTGGAEGTTYFVTISRDDDGGANNTGQLTAEIHTGDYHPGGVHKDLLTVDCSAGEQNDFEYAFGFMSYDDNTTSRAGDGFTQNLDLGEVVVGNAGIMTTNTGFWGPTF